MWLESMVTDHDVPNYPQHEWSYWRGSRRRHSLRGRSLGAHSGGHSLNIGLYMHRRIQDFVGGGAKAPLAPLDPRLTIVLPSIVWGGGIFLWGGGGAKAPLAPLDPRLICRNVSKLPFLSENPGDTGLT